MSFFESVNAFIIGIFLRLSLLFKEFLFLIDRIAYDISDLFVVVDNFVKLVLLLFNNLIQDV